MNNLDTILKNLGLGRQETLVYMGLLENGPLSVSDLAQKIGLYRPAIYKALGVLYQNGLVTRSPKDKRKRYSAEPPTKLGGLLESFAEDLSSAIRLLEEKYNKAPQPVVRLLEGKEGIRAVFNDVVETMPKGGTFYRYTSEKDLDEVNSYLPKSYRERRDTKKLERLVISNLVSGQRKKPRLERFIKFIPPAFDKFDQNIIQLIYADKVALIDLESKTSLIVHNKSLADFQEKIFKLLYKKL
jgi:sugar-specific transcriptional regulator TrmB